jgi:hypothetical protein
VYKAKKRRGQIPLAVTYPEQTIAQRAASKSYLCQFFSQFSFMRCDTHLLSSPPDSRNTARHLGIALLCAGDSWDDLMKRKFIEFEREDGVLSPPFMG